MKKWDDLVKETMTQEAITRSDERAEAMIALIHNDATVKKEARHIRADHGKRTAVPL